MNKFKVGIVSLGCDKNRIDSEIIIGKIYREYELVNDPKEAEVIIINTCGFIESAKQESIDTILEMAQYKKSHNCKVLVVTGCLTQRYGEELLELISEIDILLGVNDYDKLNDSIAQFMANHNKIFHCNYSDSGVNQGERILTTSSHTSYLRIAEGCNNFCTYCIIPKIRGKYRSRKMEDIIEEASLLARQGVKEIILVAQDTTKYGIDLYGEKKLHELIKKISAITSIEWIRILYCYPEEITDVLIDEIANNEKVCKYLDMPIQHISDEILTAMKRRGRKNQIISTIKNMRKRIPNLSLRTSLIVGFPGESEDNFNELKQFVIDTEFDKLGVFKYSQEEDTIAAEMPNQIDEVIKVKREQIIMGIQQEISTKLNAQKINKTYSVLVEGKNGEYLYGRSYEMSPQIDGQIFFKYEKVLNVGQMVNVKITKTLEYDLIGDVCDESCK